MVIVPLFIFCYKRTKIHQTPFGSLKVAYSLNWCKSHNGEGAYLCGRKGVHITTPSEMIQVRLKDVIDGIGANVFACAMEHSIQNVFFLAPPLSRHYITQSNNVHQLTLSLALTFAPCVNNILTTDSCPYQQAR